MQHAIVKFNCGLGRDDKPYVIFCLAAGAGRGRRGNGANRIVIGATAVAAIFYGFNNF